MKRIDSFETFKKPELELALDEYLAENSTQFSSDPKLAPYYSSRARTIGSPVKRDSTASDGLGEKLKVAKRRATKAIEEAPATTEYVLVCR
jgi:hypothetical protein